MLKTQLSFFFFTRPQTSLKDAPNGVDITWGCSNLADKYFDLYIKYIFLQARNSGYKRLMTARVSASTERSLSLTYVYSYL